VLEHLFQQEAVGDNSDVFPLPPSHFPGSVPDSADSDDDDVPTKAEEETPPQAPLQDSPPPSRPSTPPAEQDPVTPVHSPVQLLSKRQERSPASDIVSPEHKVPKRPPPSKPRPKAPETTARPMSDFRPEGSGPHGRFEHFRSYTHLLPKQPRSSSSNTQPLHFNFAPEQDAPPLHAQGIPEEDKPMEEDVQDEQHRESIPDPLNFLGQDAMIADALVNLTTANEPECDLLTLDEAFQFALASKLQTGKPSEPSHWKDIEGRSDAHLWHAATLEEFNALLENGTFEPVRLPAGRRAIGCRWVFKLKHKQDGSVDCYKARLVAKGFSQRPGLDFSQVLAPTARWAALRSIFALAAIEDLELYSLDISNAFLNGELDHDVYMQQPEGFQDRFGTGFVLKLKRVLYGLKQAGHQWHKKLDSVMSGLDFKLVRCDNSIWVYQNGDIRAIVPVYVDDMTIATKRTAERVSLVNVRVRSRRDQESDKLRSRDRDSRG
jgi:hypothetical protein